MTAQIKVVGVATGTGNLNALVLSADTYRNYAVITNDLSTEAYLAIGTSALLGQGILLNAKGSSYEINKDNFCTSEIRASGTASALRLCVQSY